MSTSLGDRVAQCHFPDLNIVFTGQIEIEADSYGLSGWTTDQLVDHADQQFKKDWTGISGGPGKAKPFTIKIYFLTCQSYLGEFLKKQFSLRIPPIPKCLNICCIFVPFVFVSMYMLLEERF